MIYLALHNSIEAGAALVKDGKIVAAAHEERFVRVKNYRGFPHLSIKYVLEEAGLKLSDVDCFLYAMIDQVNPNREVTERILERVLSGVKERPDLEKKYIERVTSEIAWNEAHVADFQKDLANLGVPSTKIEYIDHHHSHAASAYYFSPFEDALVFTCDGKGGFRSSSVWSAKGTTMECLDWGTSFDSAGYFYGNITKALGFKQERHEGKITGLAAYGDPDKFRYVTDQMLTTKDGRLRTVIGNYYLPWFVEKEQVPALYAEVAKHKREDVAAAVQRTLEDVITAWVKGSMERFAKNRPVNIALAGGVFANVKLNQRVREIPGVRSVYVHPAMGDGGLPLGAIAIQSERDGRPYKKFLTNAYLGPAFDRETVQKSLREMGVPFEPLASVPATLQKLFSENTPVGFFRGRMEYGPRALCNRTIMYHAKDASVNDWLNKMLNRSEFMPFAPVTTAEMAPKCFLGWHSEDYSADFMTMTYDCTEEFKKACPAAVHVDGAARPQIVRKELDPELHGILTEYFRLTGELSVLNTSFNNHEEPIVCTIDDAMKSFQIGNVGALILEGLLVRQTQAKS